MSPVFEQPECVRGNYAHNKERRQSLKERNLPFSVFIMAKFIHNYPLEIESSIPVPRQIIFLTVNA